METIYYFIVARPYLSSFDSLCIEFLLDSIVSFLNNSTSSLSPFIMHAYCNENSRWCNRIEIKMQRLSLNTKSYKIFHKMSERILCLGACNIHWNDRENFSNSKSLKLEESKFNIFELNLDCISIEREMAIYTES